MSDQESAATRRARDDTSTPPRGLPPRGLPWRISEAQPWCVYAADGRLVAYAGPPPPDPDPVRAEVDAAKIVEAVNAYFGGSASVPRARVPEPAKEDE